MEQRKYKTKAEVLARGQEAIGKTLGEIDKTGNRQRCHRYRCGGKLVWV